MSFGFVVSPDSSRVVYQADEEWTRSLSCSASPLRWLGDSSSTARWLPARVWQPTRQSPRTRRRLWLARLVGAAFNSVFAVDIGVRCNGELATQVGTDGDDTINGTSGRM